jgi:hypothetical protein
VRQAAERLLGPAVGGFVVAAVGAGGAFLVDAGTFAVSAACIWGLQVRSLPAPRAAPSARRELGEAVTFVRSQPWLWAPVSFALTGPVSKAIGTDATLVLAGVVPIVVCAALHVVAGLRRDEDLHPLLGEDYRAGVGASSADSGSGTPAIS